MNEQAAVPKLTLPAETTVPDETGLFCIDGDHTLIDGHTHNRIYNACELSKIIEENGGHEANVDRVLDIIKAKTRSRELRLQPAKDWKSLFYTLMENNMWQHVRTNKDTQWDLVKNMPPIGGDPERWKSLFLTLIEEGHSVAMVSFSKYGEDILPRYLHEVIGLEKDFIEKHIRVVSFLTKHQDTKELHISIAKEKTGRTNLSPEKIVFCDDDVDVVGKTCHNGGYTPVIADEDGTHIYVLFEKIKTLKLPKESVNENKAGTPYASPRTLSSSSDSLHISPPHAKEQSPYCSPREQGSTLNPALAAFLNADASNPPSPTPKESTPHSSPKILSSAEQLLRKSPSRAAMRASSSSECSLQNSGEYNNDLLRNSFDGVKIK